MPINVADVVDVVALSLSPDDVVMLKGVYLLTMGTFNRFLVLNEFCMDKNKY
jgi:hypothetical protein